MSKRRRNEIEPIDAEDFLNKLDNYPYLFRSIQAGEYMIANPIEFKPDMIEWKRIEIFSQCERYLSRIIRKFFTGCGLYYYEHSGSFAGDKGMAIIILSPLYESQFNVNFSIFISQCQNILMEFFKNFPFHVHVKCKSVGSAFRLGVSYIPDDDYEIRFDHANVKRSDAIDI